MVEGVAAPSGGCLRSGHKNSVKGKGAIKHKGAPTIIYHCTDAPFRLAPLATHPLSGGGQEKHGCPLPSRSTRHPPSLSGGGQEKHGGEGRLTQNLASPRLQGGGGPRLYLKSCLPLLAGGGEPRERWKGWPIQAVDACEAGIRTLSKERVPSNIKGHPPSFTIALTPPSVSLRSPPTPLSGGGQEKHGRPLPSRFARHPP